MAPVTHPDRYSDSIDFWRNVYGIDMSAMLPLAKQCAFEEPSVETITGENVLTWPHMEFWYNYWMVNILWFLLLSGDSIGFGSTPRQATFQQVKGPLVIALSLVLDNAKTVSLISRPVMTGLIMGGASPLEAIQLQIVVINMLIGASTVSSIASTYRSRPSFFTKAYQLQTNVFISD